MSTVRIVRMDSNTDDGLATSIFLSLLPLALNKFILHMRIRSIHFTDSQFGTTDGHNLWSVSQKLCFRILWKRTHTHLYSVWTANWEKHTYLAFKPIRQL